MFYVRLQQLCKQKGTTISGMLKTLNLSTGSTGNWKKGQLPKGDVLAKIANYLDTSIDYIVFGEFRNNLTENEIKLIQLYQKTPERAKYKVTCDFERIVNEEIEKYALEKESI